MNSRKKDMIFKKIPPPNTLNPENSRIWIGWNELGDREVAREAAAKGFYVPLAIEFLSHRRRLPSADAEKWFHREALVWVSELLNRRQIFKASHVLTNIGVDAAEKFNDIFAETADRELREYLGSHLMKTGGLKEAFRNSWMLMGALEREEGVCKRFEVLEKCRTFTVARFEAFDWEFKYELGVELFFKCFDLDLEAFLNHVTLWKYLLKRNEIALLRLWIVTKFSDGVNDVGELNLKSDVLEKLVNLFQKLSITAEMVDFVTNDELQVTDKNRQIILNELGKYGLFNVTDRNDCINILLRLKKTNNVANFREILSQEISLITLEKFYELLVDYCEKNELYNVLNLCAINLNIPDNITRHFNSNYANFIVFIKNSVAELKNESTFRDNLLEVANFLNPNSHAYFKTHPILLLAILTLNETADIFTNPQITLPNGDELPVEIIFSAHPFLKKIHEKHQRSPKTPSYTFHDLLQQHSPVNFNHFLSPEAPTHFNDPDFVAKHGYNKNLDFMFFLKQCRPSVACKYFVTRSGKIGEKVHKLAIENFTLVDVPAACVAFLEMIGADSGKLRVYLDAARVLYESVRFEEPEDVIEFFKNAEPARISNILEGVVMKNLGIYLQVKGSFVTVVKEYEVVCKFNTLHGLRLPEMVLKHWASNNDWLPFLLYAQLKRYPVEHVRDLVQSFKKPNLLEHVNHSVLYDIDDRAPKTTEPHDPKSYFLARVEACRRNEPELGSSVSSTSSYGSMESGFSDASDAEVLDMKATLLQTIIRCHNTVDPPGALLQACQFYRNPLLAILATSYEPDSVVTNWLTWLAVSCNLCEPITNYESISLSPQSVTEILKNVTKNGYLRILWESFEIFLYDNPLKILVEFLDECKRSNFNKNSLQPLLKLFHKKLQYMRTNSVILKIDQEVTYLNNKLWLQNTAVILITHTLEYNLKSLFDQINFLRLLTELEVSETLPNAPDFCNLLQILTLLHNTNNCDITLDLSSIYNPTDYTKTLDTCINKLLERNLFEIALSLSQIENLPADKILTLQWRDKYTKGPYDNFWNDCNETFMRHNVSPASAVKFFRPFAESVEKIGEKYELFRLARDWAQKHDASEVAEIETQMWVLYVNMDESTVSFEVGEKELYREMLCDLENVQRSVDLLKDEDGAKLNRAIDGLLNRGYFWQALKLERLFCGKNESLEILKVCASIAEGILSPYQMNAEQRMLLSGLTNRTYSHRRRMVLSRLSFSSVGSHSTTSLPYIQTMDQLDQISYDSLVTIESLVEKLKAGTEIGQKIFMTYRISTNIEIHYHLVVENDDPMKMLKDALNDDCRNKIEVIHDFILVYKWSKEKVADFACEELVNAINVYIKSKQAALTMWDLNLDTEFHLVLQILHDNCSILGAKIYSYSSALHKAHTSSSSDFKVSELALIVELVIRSHDCFTSDCNMEGISSILKKSQTLISVLLSLKSWKLIVRLLTGIARYTEMNYVFQILRENDQFEYLLSKGSKKDNSLKVALLDYLKKYCPENKELYRIVALHFNLFSEVAQLWEMEADNVITNLIAISKLEMQNNKMNPDNEPFVLFTNTDGTKICLNKAMTNYKHATEYHLQGDKLAKAMNAAKQAELIALQMSTFKGLAVNATVICFLHLTQAQIGSLIMSHLSFPQSLILMQAYNHSVDWANVLFEQYVINNRAEYLENFVKRLPLTDNLVHDMSRRFLKSNISTPRVLSSMKEVVNMVSSVHMKYKIASELGFMDIVEGLLEGNRLAYLKDTVWKKGYRS